MHDGLGTRIEEVPQRRRIHRARLPVTVRGERVPGRAVDGHDGGGRDDDVPAGATEVDTCRGRLPRRLRPAGARSSTGVGAGVGPPQTRGTAAGLSGLVYGVLDPEEVVARGFGSVSPDAVAPLRSMFPRAMPYLFADF